MRATKVCSHFDCPNIMPCPDHERKPWEKSERRTRTRSGWEQQRRAKYVLEKHNTICHVCGYPGANEADHVIPLAEGGPDTTANMRPIHAEPCHREKTAEEARRARPTNFSA